MVTVSKSLNATVANGALTFWYQGADGLLADVFAVSFQIFDAAGTQVLAKTALNTAPAPAGSRVGLGRYAAAWTPGAAAVGLYSVRWYYTVASGDTETSFDIPFELVAVPYPAGPHYCTVASLRDEGLASTGTGAVTDARAQAAIVRASRYVELYCGRSFTHIRKAVRLNGSSSRILLLDEPLVAVEEIEIADPLGGLVVSDDTIQVFNRHLREGLLDPDDRENPKLEFLHGNDLAGVNEGEIYAGALVGLVWPRGVQNVRLTALFGYTEPDGSFVGGTPAMIQEATRLLVFRNLTRMIERGGAPSTAIVQETTKDQTVIYAQPGAGGDDRARSFTGDPDIDMILTSFRRPPRFGSA